MLFRALAWALLGAVALPAAVLGLLLVAYTLSDQCGRASDDGGCERGIAMAVLEAVPASAILFFVGSLAANLFRTRRKEVP